MSGLKLFPSNISITHKVSALEHRDGLETDFKSFLGHFDFCDDWCSDFRYFSNLHV